MKRILPLLLLTAFLSIPVHAGAQALYGEDAPSCREWVRQHFGAGKRPPFSFRYDGVSSDRFIKKWRYSRRSGPVQDDDALLTRHFWRDPRTGLEVECAVKTFPDAEAMEWVLYFRGGKTRTGQINDVRVVDLALPAGPEARVFHAEGSTAEKKDFHPRETVLQAGDTLWMKPYAGRSSSHAFPYFNVRTRGGGMVFAIGWTGTWKASVFRGADGKVGVNTGMVFLDTWLEPGEEIRTPMTAMLPWRGDDRMAGQNALRRFIMAHHYPRIRGEKVHPPLCASFNFGDPPPCNVYSCFTTSYALALVERYRMFGIVPEVFWLDAGWYGPSARWQEGYDWCNSVGSWQVDSTRFPNGLGEIADAVHEAGSQFMVWYEPERVVKDSDWAYLHPEYLLEAWGKPVEPHPIDRSYPDSYLLDLGNPEANRWMREEVARMLREGRVDHFRQDFNIEPEAFWYNNDAPGRLGIREIRYITGLYTFWDWLREEFPDLFIDNCASGGRRLDLEATSRCIPLWRTDYDTEDPDICQSQTFGLSLWLPVHGTAVWRDDPYVARSSLSATTIFNWKVTSPQSDIRRMHARMAEFDAVHRYFMDDFHPLIGEGDLTRDDILLAWQLDRPEDGTGWISVFRREKAPQTSALLHLKALEPDTVYEIEDWDTHERIRKTGRELAEGFEVALPAPRTARLLRYGAVTGPVK